MWKMGHQQLAYGAGHSLNTLICCTLYAFEEVQPEVKSLLLRYRVMLINTDELRKLTLTKEQYLFAVTKITPWQEIQW